MTIGTSTPLMMMVMFVTASSPYLFSFSANARLI